MYLCAQCRTQISANIPSFLYPLKTRSKTYPKRANANIFRGESKIEQRDDRGGQGFEIVEEIRVCPTCHELLIKD